MKHFLISILVLSTTIGAEAKSRMFTLPDGRTLEAEVLSYYAPKNLVELKRADGKVVKITPATFIEADQEYINSWVASQSFVSNSSLKISLDDKEVDSRKEKTTKDIRYTGGTIEKDFVTNVITFENIAFELTFQNMNKISMENIRMEYQIYYEQSKTVYEVKPEPEQKIYKGKMEVPAIAPKAKITVLTEPVEIYEDEIIEIPQSNGDQRRGGKGKVYGARIRLYMASPSGDEVMRELSSPSTLSEKKYPWVG